MAAGEAAAAVKTMTRIIPHSRPVYDAVAQEAVREVLASGKMACGSKVAEAEDKFAEMVGAESAVMVSSGLTALRFALQVLNLRRGDRVLIPAYVCVALPDACATLELHSIACHIERDGLTLSLPDVKTSIPKWRPTAVVGVHIFGAYCNIPALKETGLPVIEDMAHGIFPLVGDIAITSCYPTKSLSGGGGGFVAGKWDYMALIREHRHYGDKPPGPRTNSEPNEVEAALAIWAMDNLFEWQHRRADLIARYHDLLGEGPWQLPRLGVYRYVLRLTEHDAKDIAAKMQAKGVMAEQPVWDWRCKDMDYGEDAAWAFKRCLSLPCYPSLTEAEQDKVIETLRGELE